MAVIVGLMRGGVGPALLATVLGFVIAFWFFTKPRGPLLWGEVGSMLHLAMFMATGGCSSLLAACTHSAARRVKQQAEEVRTAADLNHRP